jgi:predicted protein tyrosine phosphatase
MANYLFVCAKNLSRSPYCEKYFRNFLKEKSIEGKVTSAGTHAEKEWGRYFTRGMYDENDVIFVMEGWMKNLIVEDCKCDGNKIVVLDILDIYDEGEFSLNALNSILFYKRNPEEKKKTLERPEIKSRASMREILDSKNLEQYIIR